MFKKKEAMDYLIMKGYKVDDGNVISPRGEIIKKRNYYKSQKGTKPYILIQIKIDKKIAIRAHQFVYYYYTGELVDMIDHINGDTLDNRIENLRKANAFINNQNRKGVKGYHKTKSGKYSVTIRHYGERKYCGVYDTEEEAKSVYLYWKSILHA